MKLVQLKILPVLGSIALALMITPTMSLADKNDREQRRHQDASQIEKHHRDTARAERRHDRHQEGNEHRDQHRYKEFAHNHGGKKYVFRHDHKNHHRHPKHAHKHHNKHKQFTHYHGHRAHSHDYSESHYIVRERTYQPTIDLHDLRFMFGLQTDKFHLILRD
ncbi:MAG: hypothetical protein OEZ38_02085 [Gammaproteobacteria bacterium]|nr:hypothetical protein [Gammaproteobacteria bacterium]